MNILKQVVKMNKRELKGNIGELEIINEEWGCPLCKIYSNSIEYFQTRNNYVWNLTCPKCKVTFEA